MGRIIRRPEVKSDLFDIWSFIAADNETRADAFLVALEKKFFKLSEAPLIGVEKLPALPKVRIFPYKDYIILYEPLPGGEGIELIRVLHGAREWRRLFAAGDA